MRHIDSQPRQGHKSCYIYLSAVDMYLLVKLLFLSFVLFLFDSIHLSLDVDEVFCFVSLCLCFSMSLIYIFRPHKYIFYVIHLFILDASINYLSFSSEINVIFFDCFSLVLWVFWYIWFELFFSFYVLNYS